MNVGRPDPDLVERLDRLLPQTQCGQCGFDGCRPYAEAMASGDAGIDRCPPGGDAGARALARLLGVPALPYDRSRGRHAPALVAAIVDADCIGCTKTCRSPQKPRHHMPCRLRQNRRHLHRC